MTTISGHFVSFKFLYLIQFFLSQREMSKASHLGNERVIVLVYKTGGMYQDDGTCW